MTNDGSSPTFCGSTSTAAPRTPSGSAASNDFGDPMSSSAAETSPLVPGTHAYEPTVIAREIGETTRPAAGPRVQRASSAASSKCALS